MRSLGLQIALLILILAACAASFFLPAVNMDAVRPGYIAFVMSMVVLKSIEPSAWGTHLYLGSFWIANLFMLAAPFGLWRARLGKGAVFMTLFVLWDLLVLSYYFYHRFTNQFAGVLVGWWVWVGSLVAMSVLIDTTRRTMKRAR